jgi:hypothetical protein
MLGPAIAALTLATYGHDGLGESLGHNARFASIGSAVAAGVMGAFGTYVSQRAVFVLCAALTVPVVFALTRMGPADRAPVDPETGHATATACRAPQAMRPAGANLPRQESARVCSFRCAALPGQRSGPPIAVNELTKMYGDAVGLWLSASIVVPQIVVASQETNGTAPLPPSTRSMTMPSQKRF